MLERVFCCKNPIIPEENEENERRVYRFYSVKHTSPFKLSELKKKKSSCKQSPDFREPPLSSQ